MSSYIFQEFVKDFSKRTSQNMKVINDIYNEHLEDPKKEVYEVTQLINSLFGMIIVPFEKYKNDINETEYVDKSSYKQIQIIIRDLRQNKFLRSTYDNEREGVSVFGFIRHLRNALAHSGNGRLNFYPVSNKDNIKAVYFIDKYENNKDGRIDYFCCKISVKRIGKLCELISALYETIEERTPESERESIYNQYKKQISQIDRFLKGMDIDNIDNIFS